MRTKETHNSGHHLHAIMNAVFLVSISIDKACIMCANITVVIIILKVNPNYTRLHS